MKLKDAYINDKIMKSFPAFCDKWMDLDGFILCERNHLGKRNTIWPHIYVDFLFFYFKIIIFLLYNIVMVLPYINKNPPWVYTCSPSWTPLPPPSSYRPSGSSQCTSSKLPVSCIEPGLAIRFLYDIIHVLMPFSQIIPHPLSHRIQKTILYISVSFAVSHTGLSLSSF